MDTSVSGNAPQRIFLLKQTKLFEKLVAVLERISVLVCDNNIAPASLSQEKPDCLIGVEVVGQRIVADEELAVARVEALQFEGLARHFVIFPARDQATDRKHARILLLGG